MVVKDRFRGIWDIAGKGTCGKTRQRGNNVVYLGNGRKLSISREWIGWRGKGETDGGRDEKGPACHTDDLDLTSGWSQVMNFHCFKRHLFRDKHRTRTLGESTGRASIQWFNQCFLSPYCLLVACYSGHWAYGTMWKKAPGFLELNCSKRMISRLDK